MRQHHTGLNNNNEFDHVSYESLDGDILDEFSQNQASTSEQYISKYQRKIWHSHSLNHSTRRTSYKTVQQKSRLFFLRECVTVYCLLWFYISQNVLDMLISGQMIRASTEKWPWYTNMNYRKEKLRKQSYL